MSYQARTGAVLFAKDLDRIAAFYASVLGLTQARRDEDHILLESPGFQLVVHRIIGGGSTTGDGSAPSARRSTASPCAMHYTRKET